MAGHVVPHFHNDAGKDKIRIGVREFQCMGAKPPFDHPHVYLDMGKEDQIICPYCSTVYVHDTKLKPTETVPAGCLYKQDEAA